LAAGQGVAGVKVGPGGATFEMRFDGQPALIFSYTKGTGPAPVDAYANARASLFVAFPWSEKAVDEHTRKVDAKTCDVFFEPGTSADETAVVDLVRQLEGKLADIWKPLGHSDVVEKLTACEFFIGAKARPGVDEGNALGYQDAYSFVFMLAPSAHAAKVGGKYGIPMTDYWNKTLAHEFFQATMYAVSAKGGRYGLGECPVWFVQGLQEHVGLAETAAGSKATRSRYVADALAISRDVEFRSDGLRKGGSVEEGDFAYFFGTGLVQWLVDTKGLEPALKVVAAVEHATCQEALDAEFGTADSWNVPFTRWAESY
jgi:hypothetical protein